MAFVIEITTIIDRPTNNDLSNIEKHGNNGNNHKSYIIQEHTIIIIIFVISTSALCFQGSKRKILFVFICKTIPFCRTNWPLVTVLDRV